MNVNTISASPSTMKTAQASTVATKVTPSGDKSKSKYSTLCKFQVKNVAYNNESGQDPFFVVLNPNTHGLYDLIDAVFKHSLTKLTEECWTIDSRLWTVDYGNKSFVSYVDTSILELYEKKPHRCDHEEPRIFGSDEMKQLVDLEKGTKGNFSLDHRPLRFNFTLVDSNVAVDDANKDATDKPQCIAIESRITYTADKKAEYVTPAEHIALIELTSKYKTFYSGMNGWSRNKRNHKWEAAKPKPPEWSSAEHEIISLFMRGGWKFANSWKFGLQYAFPHRTKAATQQKWYHLNKHQYMTEYHGKNMSINARIIHAKKLCKELMDNTLDNGPPKPLPKPLSYLEREELDDFEDFGSPYEMQNARLPKRSRTDSFDF